MKRNQIRRQLVGGSLLLAAILTGDSHRVSAQVLGDNSLPRRDYYLGFTSFYEGEYRNALKAFQSAGRTGINTGQGRWVDSICYYTMIGECLYHMGDLRGALESYDTALNLAIVRNGWLKRIREPPGLGPQPALIPVNWGPSARNTVPGGFPDPMYFLRGTDIDQVVRQGGTVEIPELMPIHLIEVMRCEALALKRRAEILGPVGPHLPLTQQLVLEFQRARGHVPANHWLTTLIDIQIALAKLAAGERDEATVLLQRSVTVGGRFDHVLTPIALITLAQLALESGDTETAQRSFFEASFPAAQFGQGDCLEEAMVGAARVHGLRGEAGIFAPATLAAEWALQNGMDRAAAAMWMATAENAAFAGEGSAAGGMLERARRAMGRSDLPASDLGASFSFISSTIAYQSGSIQAGDRSLSQSLPLLRKHARRLFQLELAHRLYVAKELSSRIAGQIFEYLLGEPSDNDWSLRPAETLVVRTSPLENYYQLWLQTALERDDLSSILMVSEMVRRHKFFQATKLGGRVLALRWVLEAPEAALSAAARQQRQRLHAKFANVKARSDKLLEMKVQLQQLPVEPEDPQQQADYQRVTRELMTVAAEQEQALHALALRPEPVERAFPPLLSLEQFKSRVGEGQAFLVLIHAGRSYRAVLIANQTNQQEWSVSDAGPLNGMLATLLREIGNYDRNQVLPADRLTSEGWKDAAAGVYRLFAQQLPPERLSEIKELVIVPDGLFWYLPFELLQVDVDGQRKALIDLVQVRYAPTLGLAVADSRPAKSAGDRVVVQGRLYSRDQSQMLAEEAELLRAQHDRGLILRKRLPVTSQYLAPSWQQLVVLDDIELNDRSPLAWSPAQIDQGKPGGSLSDWISLPFGAPDCVVLPGYRTLAEDGLRGRPNGDELLMATTGLMAAGTRTIVLARWRTGGRLSLELVREFLQQLPEVGAAAAWQRAVLLARSAELDPATEPRLRSVTPEQVPTAEHPFFWAGQMMIGAW